MAHGTPDWGLTAGTVTTYQLTDLAELAVRLGSIVSYDRRGEVLFLDDFQHGLSLWDPDTSGAGADVYLSTELALSGSFACKLIPGTATGNYALIQTYLSLPPLSRMGVQYFFSHLGTTQKIDFDLAAEWASGQFYASVRYDDVADELLVYNSAGVYVSFATGIALTTHSTIFSRAKLVIDLSTGTYVRFLLNDVEYDLSAYAIRPNATLQAGTLYTSITTYRLAGGLSPILVDNVIVPHNEP